MKKLIKNIPLLLIAFIILLATLSIPKTVYNKTEMKELKLGYPLAFVIQDFTKWDPPFPYKFNFGLPQEHPTQILWFNVLISYLIIFAITKLITLQIQKPRKIK